jgi:hypothetical protein
MCRDIAWWEVNEVQIPGNKIEPQWPFLDTLTQKYDYAWEALSRYLKDNWLVIVKDKHFFLDNVFPNDTKVNAIRVHLFFVKLLGCMIAEYGIPINISGFSNAVLNEKSHRDIFLTFIDASKLENDLGKFVDRTPIEALIEHGIIVHTAIFLYTLYPVSIRVAYLPTKPIRELRYKAWHPRQISNQVNIGRF